MSSKYCDIVTSTALINELVGQSTDHGACCKSRGHAHEGDTRVHKDWEKNVLPQFARHWFGKH